MVVSFVGYTYIILLTCRRCEWVTCPPLSAWTHAPAPAGCWDGACMRLHAWWVGAGGTRAAACKSLGTGSHPVAHSHPWSWSPTQTMQQAREAATRLSLQRWHSTCPSPNAALPEGLLLGEGCPMAAPGSFPHPITQENGAALLFAPKTAPGPGRNHISPHCMGTWKQGQSWSESYSPLCG